MANRTDPLAHSIHGTNPQFLFSKIVRSKIYQSPYWKQQCFGLTAESIIDKAVELEYVGGTYGGARKPSPFLCLTLKMLQIQPSLEIAIEYLKNGDFKYLRALAAFYLRLTASHKFIYTHLEPLLADYRKIRIRSQDGRFQISHIDEFIDNCLRLENYLDIDLPSLVKREFLESLSQLSYPRPSALDQDIFIEGIKFDEDNNNTTSSQLLSSTHKNANNLILFDSNNKKRTTRKARSSSAVSSTSTTSSSSSINHSKPHRRHSERHRGRHHSRTIREKHRTSSRNDFKYSDNKYSDYRYNENKYNDNNYNDYKHDNRHSKKNSDNKHNIHSNISSKSSSVSTTRSASNKSSDISISTVKAHKKHKHIHKSDTHHHSHHRHKKDAHKHRRRN